MKIVAVVFVCLFPSLAFATPLYHFTDLGPGFATCINDSGTIAGYSPALFDTYHATVWSEGIQKDLGVLYGDTGSFAKSINNFGQIVGYSHADGLLNPFMYDGVMHQLPVVRALPNAVGLSINDSGTIIGYGYIASPGTGQMMWKPDGTPIALGDGIVRSINNQGAYVGKTSEGVSFMNDGTQHTINIPAGFQKINPLVINNKGSVAGIMTSQNIQHGFLLRDGNITDLGAMPGTDAIMSLNDLDQVVLAPSASLLVGYYWDTSLSDLRTLITDAPLNLNSLSPNDINNKGMIVGDTYIGLERHAFLLTPVPEPTCSLLILGLGLLLIRRR
jgi:probable HAF family extracellular repeat protein